MIDLATEQLIPISQVPKLLPRRPNGKTVHISAVYRWITSGISSRDGQQVKLESTRVGGSTYVSLPALQRFSDALSGLRQAPPPTSRMSRTRQAQAARAAQEVRQQLGIKQPSPKTQPSANSRIGITPDAPSVQYGSKAQTLSQKEVDGETTSKPNG